MSSSNPPGLDAFIESMIALAVSIGFLVILLSMYTTVIERTRDIGVLKSIGASKGYIIRALLGESIFICTLWNCRRHWDELCLPGHVSFFVSDFIHSDYAGMDCAVRADRHYRRIAGRASYPAWLASRKDAIEALSYD